MNNDELKSFYIEEGCPSGNDLKRAKYREFVKNLKREFSFINEMGGRREISIYLHALMNDIFEPPTCIVCGNPISTAHSKEFPKTCSRECNGRHSVNIYKDKHGHFAIEDESNIEKFKESSRKKWGADHYMKSEKGKEVHRKSMNEKFGVDNVFQLSEVKEKSEATNMKKRGVRNPLQDPSVSEKARATLMKRTGVDNPMKNPESVIKSKQTSMTRYGEEHYTKTEEYRDMVRVKSSTVDPSNLRRGHIPQSTIDILRDKESLMELYREYGGVELSSILGVNNTTVYDWLGKHGIPTENISFFEKSFETLLLSIGVKYEKNDRVVLDGYEIDFLIPDLNIGIELDGVWWHSTRFVDKNYHKMKTDLAGEKGFRLIHVFEDEWNERREQVIRKIKHTLGKLDEPRIYARKTVFEVQPPSSLKNFFEVNHIQGYGRGSLCGVLRDSSGGVVAAAVFMRSPTDGENTVILNRYATSCNVVGGLGKIVKNMTPLLLEIGYQRIVSYADLRWSVGDAYLKSGWILSGETPPDYTYVIGGSRVRKQNFRKKYLERLLDEYDPNMTEIENMDNAGIPRIYDCGLARYVYELQH